jgi:hypothetical protein
LKCLFWFSWRLYQLAVISPPPLSLRFPSPTSRSFKWRYKELSGYCTLLLVLPLSKILNKLILIHDELKKNSGHCLHANLCY